MSPLHGKSLIAGRKSSLTGESFHAISALDDQPLPGEFTIAGKPDIDQALTSAAEAFTAFRKSPAETRAAFLEEIAGRLTGLGDTLIHRAQLETGLSRQRLHTELDRTTGHLRMFARIVRDGSWLDPRIEPGDPGRTPSPRPDLRLGFQPIGPVVVFGSSNFPLAYSVAGGDTASALATGNPVIVKAHEAHPGTSELVAEAIIASASRHHLPPGIFSLLQGPGTSLGIPLVTHPATRAVGFTGSTLAGRIFIDAAAARPDPIPVFAEMGNLNPVVILPSALDGDTAGPIANNLIRSITTDAGQFCTKPGLLLIPDSPRTRSFLDLLKSAIQQATPVPMLHRGIARSFASASRDLSGHPSVQLIGQAPEPGSPRHGRPQLHQTHATPFLADPFLRHEFFGPLSLVIHCDDLQQIHQVLRSIGGQLTASFFSSPGDPHLESLLSTCEEIAGRIIANGVPTGVEVNPAIQHGGPWPACSDPRFTAVGPSALLRFVRPVSYQNFPPHLLPPHLRQS